MTVARVYLNFQRLNSHGFNNKVREALGRLGGCISGDGFVSGGTHLREGVSDELSRLLLPCTFIDAEKGVGAAAGPGADSAGVPTLQQVTGRAGSRIQGPHHLITSPPHNSLTCPPTHLTTALSKDEAGSGVSSGKGKEERAAADPDALDAEMDS